MFYQTFLSLEKIILFYLAGDCDDEKDSTMFGLSNGGGKQQNTLTDEIIFMFNLLILYSRQYHVLLRTGEREKEKDSTMFGQSNGGGKQQITLTD